MLTRAERLLIHKKQERLQVERGKPSVSSLTEGVPTLRATKDGLIEYVKYNGALYEKVFDRSNQSETQFSLSLNQSPNYDSGWVTIAVNSDYIFTHNLGTKILLMKAFFKTASSNAAKDNSANNSTVLDNQIFSCLTGCEYNESDGNDTETGMAWLMKTDDVIELGTGNDAFFYVDNTSLGSAQLHVYQGEIRLLLWDIGLSV